MAKDRDASLATALAAAAKTMNHPADLEQVLRNIVETARDTIPGFDHVGISTVHGRKRFITRAVTDDVVSALDDLQYSLIEGPCVDAMTETTVCVASNIRHEQRWPRYVPQAVRRGLRSQMAVQLHLDHEGTVGGLNLYSTTRDEIDPEAPVLAELFAAHAAISMSHATREHDLNEALFTRKTIGLAIGILMERYDLTDDKAFAFLVRTSQNSNIKLRDLATRIVDQANQQHSSPPRSDA